MCLLFSCHFFVLPATISGSLFRCLSFCLSITKFVWTTPQKLLVQFHPNCTGTISIKFRCSKLYAKYFLTRRFFKFSNISLYKIKWQPEQGRAGSILTLRLGLIVSDKFKWLLEWGQYWPWGHNLKSLFRGSLDDATQQIFKL